MYVHDSLILRPVLFWCTKKASNEKLGWGMGTRLYMYKATVFTYNASMHYHLKCWCFWN